MASSDAVPDQPFRIRSISVPSRTHPLAARVEEKLHQLRTFQVPSTSSATTETMCNGMRALGDLYNSIEELVCLPRNQQALAHPQQRKNVEVELDRSIRLLDLCSALRDNLVITKEHIQDLQSSFRRNDVSIRSKMHAYIRLRKKADKDIKLFLVSLKQLSIKSRSHPISGGDCDDILLINKASIEATTITLSLLQSISSVLTVSRPRQMISRWSFVSKALQKRKVACEQEHENDNGDGSLALALQSSYECLSDKHDGDGRIQKAQYQLRTLEGSTEGLETELECLFRRLIQNRVSLLNILSLYKL